MTTKCHTGNGSRFLGEITVRRYPGKNRVVIDAPGSQLVVRFQDADWSRATDIIQRIGGGSPDILCRSALVDGRPSAGISELQDLVDECGTIEDQVLTRVV